MASDGMLKQWEAFCVEYASSLTWNCVAIDPQILLKRGDGQKLAKSHHPNINDHYTFQENLLVVSGGLVT
ncbi:hypothetical protein Goklo_021858, partial [Gossypium klotzschianum]|nr:hypothetical protein [Gossypium klotzschianum]